MDDLFAGLAIGTGVVADVLTAKSGTPSTSPSGSYTADIISMMAESEQDSHSPGAEVPYYDGSGNGYGSGIAGGAGSRSLGNGAYSSGNSYGGDCASKQEVFMRRMEMWNNELANQHIGICRSGEISRDMYQEAAKLYRTCPILDPDGRQAVEFESAVRQSEAVMRSSCTQEFLTASGL